jgi:acetyl esterase/lipase
MKPACWFWSISLVTTLWAANAIAQTRTAPGSKVHPDAPDLLELTGAQIEVYKTVGDVALRLWRFDPPESGDAPRPAIVFFFGGGWNSGTPAQFEHQARYLASRGMVAFVADYRVLSRHQVPAVECVKDAKSAIRWVRANSKRLGVDPQRIVAAGGSAGGHLAAATATLREFDEPGEDASISSVPNACVLFNPATALAPIGDQQLTEQQRAERRKRFGVDPEQLSPFHHVREHLPPMLILHGMNDTTVAHHTAVSFAAAMRDAGNRCDLVSAPGQSHGYFNHSRGQTYYLDTLRATERFLMSLNYLADAPLPTHDILHARFEPSTKPGELAIEANYFLWIPPQTKLLRGVIVHQHGCGEGAENGGLTAVYDLHWRTLAAKHDCALLGTNLRAKGADCRTWFDPNNGSGSRFLEALAHFAKVSGHSELNSVPWALWGHSGGAVWAFRMLESYPERIAAVCLRSGRPTLFEKPDEVGPVPPLRDVTRGVPVLCNLGLKERDDRRFGLAWKGSEAWFQEWRAGGALVAFAPDPRTSHECGNFRFLAIPWLDAVLTQRLPDAKASESSRKPRAMDTDSAWLGDNSSLQVATASAFAFDKSKASWLPNEQVARIWQEFVTRGQVDDATPPTIAPEILSVSLVSPTSVELTWNATADLDSGIRGFAIFRNGRALGTHRATLPRRFAEDQFQQISYHDTPEQPLPELRFRDDTAPEEGELVYEVAVINGAGRLSPKSKPVQVRAGHDAK